MRITNVTKLTAIGLFTSQILACASTSLGLPPCDIEATDIFPTQRVLLLFQACRGTQAQCDASQDYQVWMAESDDLQTWRMVPNWTPFELSGIDLVNRSDILYFYGEPGVYRTLDLDQGALSCEQALDLVDTDGTTYSEVIAEVRPQRRTSDNRIVLSFLTQDGASATDPRTCTVLPCTRKVLTAVETASGLGARFQITDGERLSISLTSESAMAYDTDWITGSDSNGYIYTATRSDSSFQVYAASTLEGSYSSLGTVSGKGASPALLFDSENYWFFSDGLDEESPQNRVIRIYGSSTISGLSTAALHHIIEGLDFSDAGTNPIQVKEPSVILLE